MQDGNRETSGWDDPSDPVLITDLTGRTIFYTGGYIYSGYVVPDGWRKKQLRDAIERFKKMRTVFAYVLLVPLLSSILALSGAHTNLALAVLTLLLIFGYVGLRLQQRVCFGELVFGLERAPSRRNQIKLLPLLTVILLGVTYVAFVAVRLIRAIYS
jgi:hypothetical protein